MSERRGKISRNVVIIGLVALFSGFGQDLITPVLPAYLALLGIGIDGIGLIDGLLQGSTNFFRFVSGVLSDRLQNRKGLVFLGYALSSISRPLLALAGSFGFVAALRLIDGVGKGTKDAPRDALVAASASAEHRGRAFGFHRLVDTAGSVFGPLTAAALLLSLTPTLASYRLILLLAAIPGAIALTLIAFGVREPAKPRSTLLTPSTLSTLPPTFWLFTLAITVAMLTKMNDSLFLVRAGGLGIPSEWIPILFAGFTLIYAVVSYPVGILSDRFGKLPFIAAGWLTLSVVEFGLSSVPSLPATLILFGFYGLFFALTEGSARAFIADVVPANARGSAFAIFYSLTGLAVIVGGWGLGSLWNSVSAEFAFRLASAGSLLAALLFLVLLCMQSRYVLFRSR